MKNQRGFTLIETMISAAILMVVILISMGAIVNYDQQEKKSSRSIQIKKLMLEIGTGISSVRSSMPYFEIGSSAGAYILCYNKEGVQVPFSESEQIRITTAASLTTNPSCRSPIEVQVLTSMGARETTWTVRGAQWDPVSSQLIQYSPYVISRANGF